MKEHYEAFKQDALKTAAAHPLMEEGSTSSQGKSVTPTQAHKHWNANSLATSLKPCRRVGESAHPPPQDSRFKLAFGVGGSRYRQRPRPAPTLSCVSVVDSARVASPAECTYAFSGRGEATVD